ncbi:MAG: hypothetical protein EXS00_01610 [Phycisphaerales bacterium]|nr:hypothetical protein [Phycisphaerales bacterium]
MGVVRDSQSLLAGAARISLISKTPADQMANLVDLVWEQCAGNGLSWVGFYLPQRTSGPDCDSQPTLASLVLGPRRDKAACSPIGLHGACGRCLLTAQIILIPDVSALADQYIACDPLDRSELVLPCRDRFGAVTAVLDLDSHSLGAFDQSDSVHLAAALRVVGLDA